MKEKKAVTFMVDPSIWNLAKNKLNCSRSEFLEEQLKRAVNLEENEETILRKEIASLQEEINVRESKLCKLREKRLKKEHCNEGFDKSMNTINRISGKLGYIGEDKLRELSNRNNVSFGALYDECMDSEIEIKKFTAIP